MNRIASTAALENALAQEILGNLSDNIFVLDAMARFLFVSAPFGDVLGHTPDYWIGQSALDLIHPDDIPHVVQHLETAFASNGKSPQWSTTIRVGIEGKGRSPAEAHGFRLINFDGSPGVLIAMHDPSGRLERERAQRLAEQSLLNVSDQADQPDQREAMIGAVLPTMFSRSGIDQQLLVVHVTVTNLDDLIEKFDKSMAHEYLRELANALRPSSRTDDLVVRLDSSELVVACRNVRTTNDAMAIARRIFEAAKSVNPKIGANVRVGCTIASKGDDLGDVLEFTSEAEHFSTAS